MTRALFIDGENFKGKMRSVFREAGKERCVWQKYDFGGLFDKVLDGLEIQKKIFYFARIKEYAGSKEKSQQLIEDQRLLKLHLEQQGFIVVMAGRVRGQLEDSEGGKKVLVFKEKGVDVRIAVDMVTVTCDKSVQEIILCSSDSDLQPAIEETKKRGVACVYLGFESQPNKGMTYTTKRTILMRNSEILAFQK